MARNKQELKQELKKITDTVDMEVTNKVLVLSEEVKDFQLTKKTLNNIAKWALDGKSEFEIAQNLELSKKQWDYLCKVCPAILLVMQHSKAYAEVVIAGSLYQNAIGGYTIHRKQPIKIKEYEEGRVVGEHIEYAEWDEVLPPNPMLLKYLAENKLSENFGKVKVDNSKEHRAVIDAMSEDELKTIEALNNLEEENGKD